MIVACSYSTMQNGVDFMTFLPLFFLPSVLVKVFVLLPNENPSFYLILFSIAVFKIKNRSCGYALVPTVRDA